jgi:hypothetical protein
LYVRSEESQERSACAASYRPINQPAVPFKKIVFPQNCSRLFNFPHRPPSFFKKTASIKGQSKRASVSLSPHLHFPAPPVIFISCQPWLQERAHQLATVAGLGRPRPNIRLGGYGAAKDDLLIGCASFYVDQQVVLGYTLAPAPHVRLCVWRGDFASR